MKWTSKARCAVYETLKEVEHLELRYAQLQDDNNSLLEYIDSIEREAKLRNYSSITKLCTEIKHYRINHDE